MGLLTTVEAGKRLGISARRVRALLREGRMKAIKIGNTWIVEEADLVYERKRRGRWPKGEKGGQR